MACPRIRYDVHDLRETQQALRDVDLCLRQFQARVAQLESGELGGVDVGGAGDDAGGIASIPSALNVQFQAFMRAHTGTISGRLYDITSDRVVPGTEISTTSTTLGLVTSGIVTLDIGNRYRAQFGVVAGESGEVVGAQLVAA